MLIDPYVGLLRAPKPQYVLDLIRTVAPASLPVSLDELKASLRIDGTDEDDFLSDCNAAVVDQLDGYDGALGRCMVEQTWEWSIDHRFPVGRIVVPLPPLIDVTSIAYVDPDGANQTLNPSAYVVLPGPRSAVEPAPGTCWPSTACQSRAVTITFTAGYGDATAVPGGLKAAIRLMVGSLYANREGTVIDMSRATLIQNPDVAALLAPYRVRRT